MRTACILILGGLLLASCGGGGGGGGGTQTVAVPSLASLDGYLREDGGGGWYWEPGYLSPLTGEVYGGGDYVEHRQFYTFEHPALPAGASIVRATLRLYQSAVVGDPFGTLGDVIVDQVHFDESTSSSDFDGNTFNREIGVVSTDAALGYRDTIVTSAVRIDHEAGRPRSQFRLRVDMPTFGIADAASDWVRFTDAEGGAGDTEHPPVLILEVAMP